MQQIAIVVLGSVVCCVCLQFDLVQHIDNEATGRSSRFFNQTPRPHLSTAPTSLVACYSRPTVPNSVCADPERTTLRLDRQERVWRVPPLLDAGLQKTRDERNETRQKERLGQ